MTDAEKKKYYLRKIRFKLFSMEMLVSGGIAMPGTMLNSLEEVINNIRLNNSEQWTKDFLKEEVKPLLNRHGIEIVV